MRFVVYRFNGKGIPDFDDASAIVDITPAASLTVSEPGVYYVTALNRVNVESVPSKPVTVK